MTKMTKTPGAEKRGWVKRMAKTAFEKLFSSLFAGCAGISPYASQELFYYSGCGWEEAKMAQSMMRAKLYEEGE